MATKKEIRQAVLRSRLPNESRNAQAKRTGIPFVTLGRMEMHGKAPRNAVLRAAYLSAIGLASESAQVPA